MIFISSSLKLNLPFSQRKNPHRRWSHGLWWRKLLHILSCLGLIAYLNMSIFVFEKCLGYFCFFVNTTLTRSQVPFHVLNSHRFDNIVLRYYFQTILGYCLNKQRQLVLGILALVIVRCLLNGRTHQILGFVHKIHPESLVGYSLGVHYQSFWMLNILDQRTRNFVE